MILSSNVSFHPSFSFERVIHTSKELSCVLQTALVRVWRLSTERGGRYPRAFACLEDCDTLRLATASCLPCAVVLSTMPMESHLGRAEREPFYGINSEWPTSKVQRHEWTLQDITTMESMRSKAMESFPGKDVENMKKYKIVYCKFEETNPGSCSRGRGCVFAHSPFELRYFQSYRTCPRGESCGTPNCFYLHPGELSPLRAVECRSGPDSIPAQHRKTANTFSTSSSDQKEVFSSVGNGERSESGQKIAASDTQTEAQKPKLANQTDSKGVQIRETKTRLADGNKPLSEHDKPHPFHSESASLASSEILNPSSDRESNDKLGRDPVSPNDTPARSGTSVKNDDAYYAEQRKKKKGKKDPTNASVLRCDICKTGIMSRDGYNSHVRGKKHQQRIAQMSYAERNKVIESKERELLSAKADELSLASEELISAGEKESQTSITPSNRSLTGLPDGAVGSDFSENPPPNDTRLRGQSHPGSRPVRHEPETDLASVGFSRPGASQSKVPDLISLDPRVQNPRQPPSSDSSVLLHPMFDPRQPDYGQVFRHGSIPSTARPLPAGDPRAAIPLSAPTPWRGENGPALRSVDPRLNGSIQATLADHSAHHVDQRNSSARPNSTLSSYNDREQSQSTPLSGQMPSAFSGSSTGGLAVDGFARMPATRHDTDIVMSDSQLHPGDSWLDQPMSVDEWRNLENDHLKAGGIDALAFKVVRDAMLSPHVGLEERDLQTLKDIFSRVPMDFTQGCWNVSPKDLPAGFFASGVQGVRSQDEVDALNRASSIIGSSMDPFDISPQGQELLSENDFVDNDIPDYTEKLQGLILTTQFGVLHGVSSGIVLKDGYRVELSSDQRAIALHERSIFRDPLFLDMVHPDIKRSILEQVSRQPRPLS